MTSIFKTDYQEIIAYVDTIDPIKYGRTRNYKSGAVTKLSPYISRGVISTRQIAAHVLAKGYLPTQIESFLKELAWRDYFQQVWINKNTAIDTDLKQLQPEVSNQQISTAILENNTGIDAIDEGIKHLYSHGYMHNHMRMYVASLCCNVAKSHWQYPAKWMYYHLLDADWASNALSWQWVAGSFSSKKYYANQENINKYFDSSQRNTYLDVPYEVIPSLDIPPQLLALSNPVFKTNLPPQQSIAIDPALPTCIYNFYNLDPNWMKQEHCNRVLLLEPKFFALYPVADHTIEFILQLAQNIKNLQVFVGEFDELWATINANEIYYKEHPTNSHYKGKQQNRDWLFPAVQGYYPSFFAFWKKGEKYIADLQQ